MRIGAVLCSLLLVWQTPSLPKIRPSNKARQTIKSRPVTIVLRTGEKLKGLLKQMDTHSLEFTVKNTLQLVPLDDVSSILFEAVEDGSCLPTSTRDSPGFKRVTVIYREKALYTQPARDKAIAGVVVLTARFNTDGTISDIRIVRGLGFGLDEQAIEAAKKIRFLPATQDGKPVCITMQLEFSFRL